MRAFVCYQFILLLSVGMLACSAPTQTSANTPSKLLVAAENSATVQGRKILSVGRKMALHDKEIIRGSCWNYIDTVYNRAGYTADKRRYILKGKKNAGPYAKAAQIQAGDWLYYINHSYNGVEHSGIFIRWVDRAKNIGLILSYGGEARKKPGRYRNYDLSHVYTILRAAH